MNIIMEENDSFIELQGTAEGEPFSPDQLNNLLALGKKGILEIIDAQKKCLK